MLVRRVPLELLLLITGLALAAAWPLSAYAVSPLVVPGLLLGVVGATAIVQRPEVGIALAAALAPVANMPIGGARPLLFVLPALVLGMLAFGVLTAREAGWRVPGIAWAVLLFVAVSFASTLQALAPGAAAAELRWMTLAAALLVATLQICRRPEQLRVVAGGALAGLLLAALHGVVQQATGNVGELSFAVDGEAVGRVQGSFGHPNQYAGFLVTFIPLAATITFSSAFRMRFRATSALAISLALAAVTFSYTRGALLGLVAGTLVWFTVLRPRLALVSALVIAIGATALTPTLLRERFSSQSSDEVSLRSDIWRTSLDIYAKQPVLGVGVNNFAQAYETLPSTPASGSQRRLLHTRQVLVPPHAQNIFLNVLAEQGTLGFLTFAGMCVIALVLTVRGTRIRDPAGRAISLGVGAGLLVLAFHSLLDVALFGERLEFPLFALLAVIAVWVDLDRRDRRERRAA